MWNATSGWRRWPTERPDIAAQLTSSSHDTECSRPSAFSSAIRRGPTRTWPQRPGDRRLHVDHAARPRRHGQRVARRTQRRAIRAAGGGQAPQHRAGRTRRGAIQARRRHARAALASAHRATPGRRHRAERPAVPRPRARRRRADHSLLRRGAARSPPAHRPLPRRPERGRPRARQPDRPPRHQAVERAGDRATAR